MVPGLLLKEAVGEAGDVGEVGKKGPASVKNAKRKAAKRRAREAASEGEGEQQEQEEEDGGVKLNPTSTSTSTPPPAAVTILEQGSSPHPPATPDDKEKLAKTLRKKIRQANELANKKDGGENLLPEQLEKVMRISELNRQLKALGV